MGKSARAIKLWWSKICGAHRCLNGSLSEPVTDRFPTDLGPPLRDCEYSPCSEQHMDHLQRFPLTQNGTNHSSRTLPIKAWRGLIGSLCGAGIVTGSHARCQGNDSENPHRMWAQTTKLGAHWCSNLASLQMSLCVNGFCTQIGVKPR